MDDKPPVTVMVTLNEREGATRCRDYASALTRLSELPEVSSSGFTDPDADDPLIARFAFVRVAPGADPDRCVDLLNRLPEVEVAEIPPDRGLA